MFLNLSSRFVSVLLCTHQHVEYVCLILFNVHFSRAHVLFITLKPFLRQHNSCCRLQKIELLGCT